MAENLASTVTLGWSYRGFEVVQLENERLRLSVVPEIGAKIHQLVDKATDRDLLYHHPRVELRAPVFGANVDNWWTGGVDDAVPTGHPCVVDGEELPFLGEVWSMAWTWRISGPHSVTLHRDGVITPFRITKTITLRPGDRYATVDYRLRNIGPSAFPYLWGIHPALPIGPSTRIDVPASTARLAEGDVPADPAAAPLRAGGLAPWPLPSIARPGERPSRTWTHLYLSGLDSGWLAVSDVREGWGFGMTFPTEVFRSVHVWNVDGGWRGLRCVAVEPWTAQPARLDQAIAAGAADTLEPGQEATAAVRLIAFDPPEQVGGFDAEGTPL